MMNASTRNQGLLLAPVRLHALAAAKRRGVDVAVDRNAENVVK
jgi:hypothetical protein